MSKIKPILLGAFCLLVTPSVYAELDALEAEMLRHYQQPLRWDNVETMPFWRGGVQPDYNCEQNRHVIQLKAGEQSIIHLPANQVLRLYQEQAELNAQDFAISISDGSGLAISQALIPSEDKHSLLLNPTNDKPLLVHIQRRSNHSDTVKEPPVLEVSLFISRREKINQLSPYQNTTYFPACTQSSHLNYLEGKHGLFLFQKILPNQPLRLKISGELRLQLLHRLQLEAQTSQSLQHYQLQIRLDDKAVQQFKVTTRAETYYSVIVDKQAELVGREEQNFVDIPQGEHQLEISTDREIYLYLTHQDEDDYLLPELNKPAFLDEELNKQQCLLPDSELWKADAAELQTLYQWLHPDLAKIEFLANRLVQDNHYQAGGLLGSQLLKQQAKKRPDYPAAQTAANYLTGVGTFFRDLLPNSQTLSANFKNTPLKNQYTAWFISRKLRDIGEEKQQPITARALLADYINSLSSAYFTALMGSNTYLLPAQNSPSTLRIIIDKQKILPNSVLHLQIDNNPAIAMSLLAQNIPADDYQVNLNEAALNLLQRQYGIPENISLSGAFAFYNEAAALIPVAHFDMALPKNAHSIKIWQEKSIQPMSLALQYQTAKKFALNEVSYLTALNKVDKHNVLANFAQALQNKAAGDTTTQELFNQWQPLVNLIQGEYQQYISSVAQKQENFAVDMPSTLVEHTRVNNSQNQDQVLALEELAETVRHEKGVIREQAQLKQASVLLQLGENYLAIRLWRYLSLYAENSQIQQQAVNELTTIYAAEENTDALQNLQAVLFMRQPNSENLLKFCQTLIANNQYELALTAAVLLPDNIQKENAEKFLSAALKQNWNQSFQNWLSFLDEPAQQFWLGKQAHLGGNELQTVYHWQYAGERGKNAIKLLGQGVMLRQALLNKNPTDNKTKTLLQFWQAWQQQQGEKHWVEAGNLIQQSAGGETYYRIGRDTYSQGFRSENNKPVKIKVTGKTRLKFEIRPLHPRKEIPIPINDWITIRQNQQLELQAITNNLPSQGLLLSGNQHQQIGEAVNFIYDIAAGVQELELSSPVPIVVKVWQEQNTLPLLTLPPLNPLTLAATLKPAQATEMPHTAQLLYEKDFYLYRMNAQESTVEAVADGVIPRVVTKNTLAELLAKRQFDALLKLAAPSHEKEALARITALVWLGETQPDYYAKVLPIAESISQHYDLPAIKNLWTRLSAKTYWQPINSIESSAGLYYRNVLGWQPDIPYLRIRKALLSEIGNQEQVIFGNNQVFLDLFNLQANTIHISAKQEDIAFLPEQSVSLIYQIGNQAEKTVVLTRENGWQNFSLSLPQGSHQIRLSLRNTVMNQFVRLRFNQQRSDQMQVLVEDLQRAYYVATEKQPLKIQVLAPTWLRIDEWVNNKLFSRYQGVQGKGWQAMTLKPTNQQAQSFFRVAQRQIVTEAVPPPLNRLTDKTPVPAVQPAWLNLAEETSGNVARLVDKFELGGQEDGTFSFGVNGQRRFAFDDITGQPKGSTGQAVAEQFMEYHGTHRYFAQSLNTYFMSRLFGRVREYGDPSFGITELAEYHPQNSLLQYRLQGNITAQPVGNNLAWTGLLTGTAINNFWFTPKTNLYSTWSVFGRYVSLRHLSQAAWSNPDFKRQVDQDVYTPYKAQHTIGQSFSFTLQHRPWLDTLWSAGVTGGSNENFNIFQPDHLGLNLKWKQAVGEIIAETGYQSTWYQKDKDRNLPVKRSQAYLNLGWYHWLDGKNLLQLDLQFYYDLQQKLPLGMLGITWHFGEGRIYRDFRPSEIDFNPLLERRYPQQENNALEFIKN